MDELNLAKNKLNIRREKRKRKKSCNTLNEYYYNIFEYKESY